MYLGQVSRPSAPGGAPIAIGELPDWLPQPLQDLGPTKLFIYGAVTLVFVGILLGGGITGGGRRR